MIPQPIAEILLTICLYAALGCTIVALMNWPRKNVDK